MKLNRARSYKTFKAPKLSVTYSLLGASSQKGTACSDEKEISFINRLNDGSIDGIFVISETPLKKSVHNLNNFPLSVIRVNSDHSIKDIERLTKNCLTKFLI